MPASASPSSRTRPAGPTNGTPSRSSRSPGCSPTNIATERAEPAPKTVCVASSQSGQARHPAAAPRSFASVGFGGRGRRRNSASHGAFPRVTGRSIGVLLPPREGCVRRLQNRCFVCPLRSSSGGVNRASQLGSIGGSVVVRPTPLRLLDGEPAPGDATLVESYRKLADVFHEVLAEQSLDALL